MEGGWTNKPQAIMKPDCFRVPKQPTAILATVARNQSLLTSVLTNRCE